MRLNSDWGDATGKQIVAIGRPAQTMTYIDDDDEVDATQAIRRDGEMSLVQSSGDSIDRLPRRCIIAMK